jgi:hypothetical protein
MIFGGMWNQLLDFLLLTVIYRKIINNADTEKLQELDKLGEWAVENAMKINPSKSKAICFTRARIKDPLNYSLMATLIL